MTTSLLDDIQKLQQKAPELDTPDYLGALAEALKPTWPLLGQQLDALASAWSVVARRAALTAVETQAMAQAWDKVTQALRAELSTVQLKTANQMIIARAEQVAHLLETVDFRNQVAGLRNADAAAIRNLAGALGPLVTAVDLFVNVATPDATSYKVGETAAGALMGTLVGVMVGAAAGAVALPV